MMNKAIELSKISLIGAVFFGLLAPAVYASSPSATTERATNITANGATLNGTVDTNRLPLSVWFEYGRDRDLDDAMVVNASSAYNTGYFYDDEDFSANIAGLRPDTTYYFRVIAQNPDGRDRGSIRSFSTREYDYYYPNYNTNYYYPAGTANYYYPAGSYNYNTGYGYDTVGYNNTGYSANLTVTTQAASLIGSDSAELNAMIYNTPGAIANTWFEWGATGALGNSTTPVSTGTYPSVKHVNKLSGLAPGTTYYYRAVAESPVSKNVGTVLSFTTSGAKSGASTDTYITNTPTVIKVVPEPAPTPKPDSLQSQLGASVVGFGPFFPVTILGWLLLFILVLVVVVLAKHAFRDLPSGKNHK